MANIFTLENFTEFTEKINMDDLYEKKRQNDQNKLEFFKKILNRVHVRIKTTAKQSAHEKFCWYVVPEIIIGVPRYDQAGCIAYVMDALQENGFNVRYFHPNTLFICWEHWIPTYVRTEIKKKTGVQVNEYGHIIEQEKGEDDEEENVEQSPQGTLQQVKNSKKYTPINSYKPSGKLVYSEDLLNKIGDKIG
jgi:hypothetical protein